MFDITLAATGNSSWLIIWVVVFIGIMYFMILRPNNKEKKRVQEMMATMGVGDYVVTTGGFYGQIISITDDDVVVEFGNNKNCRIPMKKAAIAQVEKAGSAVEVPAEPKKKGLAGKASAAKEEIAQETVETVDTAAEAVEEVVEEAEE